MCLKKCVSLLEKSNNRQPIVVVLFQAQEQTEFKADKTVKVKKLGKYSEEMSLLCGLFTLTV